MQFPRLARQAIAMAALALSAGGAHAVPLVGLTTLNGLARFDTANVAVSTTVAITGLAAGDRFVGIDLRPSNNLIYGITLSNQIYTVNEFTGAATFVAALSSPIINSEFRYGIDFNPVADFGGAASLRLVSDRGGNFAINVADGTVGNAANTIENGFTGVAYTNSMAGGGAPASTALYYINSLGSTLSVATSAFNAPTITTVGALGIFLCRPPSADGCGFTSPVGFEIASNGVAYGAFNFFDNNNSLNARIYTVNLATGAATSIGMFNGTLSGLTVSAVPQPGTYALMVAGLAGLGFVARRRRVGTDR